MVIEIKSNTNTNLLTVSNIDNYNITNQTTYNSGDIVIYENIIYECISTYTTDLYNMEFPNDSDKWTNNVSYLRFNENILDETIYNTEIYLTTNKFRYEQLYLTNNTNTILYFVEKYIEDFNQFNIDIRYDSIFKRLYFTGKLPDEFFKIESDTIINNTFIREKLIEVSEELNTEFDNNISKNSKYKLKFKDIDENGIDIRINDQVFFEDTIFIFNNGVIDMERTIDKTLRNWLISH